MLKVTCAIIVFHDKILIVQRNVHSDHPLQWEFPGGKLNPGESPEECVTREIWEELGIETDILKPLEPVYHDYGIKQIELIPFICRIKSGDISLNEHLDFKWITFDNFEEYDFAEADRRLIQINSNRDELKKHLRENMNNS